MNRFTLFFTLLAVFFLSACTGSTVVSSDAGESEAKVQAYGSVSMGLGNHKVGVSNRKVGITNQ